MKTVTGRAWNPQYVLYAKAHGRSPVDQLEYDKERWPGGVMCGYILWVQRAWREWDISKGRAANDPKGPAEHSEFDEWLSKEYDNLPKVDAEGYLIHGDGQRVHADGTLREVSKCEKR